MAFEELQTQNFLENELAKINCRLKTFSTSTLYHEHDLPFSFKDIPDVFTNFRKEVEKEAKVRPVFAKPTIIHSPIFDEFILPNLNELGLENMAMDKRAVLTFKGGETAAWERLNHYFFENNFLSVYKETRNELVGAD